VEEGLENWPGLNEPLSIAFVLEFLAPAFANDLRELLVELPVGQKRLQHLHDLGCVVLERIEL
jgi:hypothetical protein